MPSPFIVAELLSIGSELTVGESRDTNAGDLARSLTGHGVEVRRIQALPDVLTTIAGAFADALAQADLVVSTGGLGPTPDDLTREALAEVCAERPAVDPELAAWLRSLWARRGLDFPSTNLKQAWRIPSAVAIPNANGTAPGWWVERPEGRVIVSLPGPPREMRPMWEDWVLPRLVERGLGREVEARTLRLAGIGESHVAEILGETLLRGANPEVATYARADGVDVRIAAVAANGRSAAELADAAESVVVERLGDHVWARGETTWPQAIETELAARGWTLAIHEAGTGGSLVALVGGVAGMLRAEVVEAAGSAPRADDGPDDRSPDAEAARVRRSAGADVGVAVRVRARGDDTAVSVAVDTPHGSVRERRLAFLGGAMGRQRAALVTAEVLLRQLRAAGERPSTPLG